MTINELLQNPHLLARLKESTGRDQAPKERLVFLLDEHVEAGHLTVSDGVYSCTPAFVEEFGAAFRRMDLLTGEL